MERTIEQIQSMSYPDFIAFLGQQNTPPGGHATLDAWIREAEIDASSVLLDLACSTGFSSRGVAQRTGCRGVGIDLVEYAVVRARQEAAHAGLDGALQYEIADAAHLPFPDGTFTHILAGCTFGFIGARQEARDECARVLRDHGKLCVANFFYTAPPPNHVVDLVTAHAGFRTSSEWTEAFWEDFFTSRFRLLHTQPIAIPVIDAATLEQCVRDEVYTRLSHLRRFTAAVQTACYNRLLSTRRAFNEHRRYQGAVLQVWGV